MFKILIGILLGVIIVTGILFWNQGITPKSLSDITEKIAPRNIVSSLEPSGSAGAEITESVPFDGEKLPLGDKKYVTDAPKKGYIFLCQAGSGEGAGGAGHDGPWIHGSAWNPKEKLSITGSVSWPDAHFSNLPEYTTRMLSGNGLPVGHTTGVFPVQSSDPAYQYDRNPNSISAQSISLNLPKKPKVSEKPTCMGGEVGIMLTGVPLFNGFDATLRDAAAHEVQDSCQGHPQVSGQYHYHSLSSCIKDVSATTVIGFALDGFPITGPQVSGNKVLTTNDLDECHGMTGEITLDGLKVSIYHYVMTQDFPYSVSCFKGIPISMQVAKNARMPQIPQTPSNSSASSYPSDSEAHQPPQEAIAACTDKAPSSTCSFSTPKETITGSCQTLPGRSDVLCVPHNP